MSTVFSFSPFDLIVFWKGLGLVFQRGNTVNRPYAYDVTEGRPPALGVKRGTATCVIAKHAARGGNSCMPHRRAGPPGPAH